MNDLHLPITKRQYDVLTFYRSFCTRAGYSPTMGEVAKALGISRTAIHEHVRSLVKLEHLNRIGVGNQSRNYKPVTLSLCGFCCIVRGTRWCSVTDTLCGKYCYDKWNFEGKVKCNAKTC
ncbi:hypothetical protein DRH27_04705 [Candidatus Falkowbacteria bacterium]|nr:MAG: hypothetical protein DRH27_04705 [Candidatus Falkowbacteria bacterium]